MLSVAGMDANNANVSPLTEEGLNRLRAAAGRFKPAVVAKLLGVAKPTLLAAMAGVPVRSATVEQIRARMSRWNEEGFRRLDALVSPMQAFIRERCTLGPMETSDSKAMFAAWSRWCMEQNRYPGHQIDFGRKLMAALPDVVVSRARSGDKRRRVYHGVGLKPAS